MKMKGTKFCFCIPQATISPLRFDNIQQLRNKEKRTHISDNNFKKQRNQRANLKSVAKYSI